MNAASAAPALPGAHAPQGRAAPKGAAADPRAPGLEAFAALFADCLALPGEDGKPAVEDAEAIEPEEAAAEAPVALPWLPEPAPGALPADLPPWIAALAPRGVAVSAGDAPEGEPAPATVGSTLPAALPAAEPVEAAASPTLAAPPEPSPFVAAAPGKAPAPEPKADDPSARTVDGPAANPAQPHERLARLAHEYTVATPVPAPGWSEHVAERVAFIANARIDEARINVRPAELGPVEVRIVIEDGRATVALSAPSEATRVALEGALGLLAERLADQGLALDSAFVSDGRSGGSFDDSDRPPPRHPASAPGTLDDALPEIPTTRAPRGLLDDFA